jgi:hypothetical protein
MIVDHMNNPGEFAVNLIYILISISVSLIYWIKDSNTGIKRISVSAHSVILLAIFGATFVIGYYGYSDKSLLMPFYFLLAVPIASMIASLILFTGSKWIHLVHIWNLLALPWTWFVGSMAVSGDWL